ncbi:MAG: hypothetical protein JSU72_01725 [Deltaproteobacteria bacterium]|nr:MAG: hypothetical protein JSU72_01725 [Deltaproteobacteria bacterium]
MKKQILHRLATIVLVLSLSGCTAFRLRDANEQLTSYYYAKQQATQNSDYLMRESVKSSLGSLATDAAEQAEREKNVLNQIAFYRVASTAAWQAGNPNVVSHAEAGKKLCTDRNFNRAPRDCGMLLVIPFFAGVDETTDRFNELQAEVTAAPADERASHAQATEKVFADYRAGLTSILTQRLKLANSAAHPDLLEAVDQNTGKLLCTLIEIDAVGLIATARGDVARAVCEVHKLKVSAFDAGLNQSSADCLPESKDKLVKPQGCP